LTKCCTPEIGVGMSFRPTTVLENIMALIVLKTRILASLKMVG
jgi:hypothetical protein